MSTAASFSRRRFLRDSSLAAGAVASGLSVQRAAHAAGGGPLKVGLVGCGGRGSGAAANALNADPQTKLVAVADPFEDRAETCLKNLRAKYADRIDVPAEHVFGGFDGYQKVIELCDVALLCSPPHFRPIHLKAAIDAGKHVFCEKPVAVDAPGVRSILETSAQAEKKGLSLVSGLCWRYHPGVQETMKRVHDGQIGRLVSIQENYLTGFLWHRGRQADDTEMKYQMRNWYYFTWLSGDHNVEQHIHSLDKALWAFHDEPPVRAYGMGGRQVRTDPMWGDIYDHHAVVYEYPDDAKVFAFTRQQDGTFRETEDYFYGTKGTANVLKFSIQGENRWRFKDKPGNMYDLEHIALFDSIRQGKPINNGLYMARSTMMAILGRMVNYTGQAITWEQALASEQSLLPAAYTWEADPPTLPDKDGRYPVAVPGMTKFV